METDVERFAHDIAADSRMRDAVKSLGADIAKIVNYANDLGYRFTSDELDELADQYDRFANPLVFAGLRRQGWHLKPLS
jgi:Nif11 domain